MTTTNSKTHCPTCGAEVTVEGEGSTHFYVPVKPNLDKQLEEEAEKVYASMRGKPALKTMVKLAKSESARQFHQQGMFTEQNIEEAIEFGLQYAFDQKYVLKYQKDKNEFINQLKQK